MCMLYNSINGMQRCILYTPKKTIQHQWVTTVTTLSASAPSARPASPQTTESSDGYPHGGAQQRLQWEKRFDFFKMYMAGKKLQRWLID
jgi:hypothetical protein